MSIADFLSRAYRAEALEVLAAPNLERGIPGHGALTKHEALAGGVMARRLVRQSLRPSLFAVVDARHTVAASADLLARKGEAVAEVAEQVAGVVDGDAGYLRDLVAAWAGLSRDPDSEWCERLGMSPRALKYWRYGSPAAPGRRGKPGVLQALEQLENDAERALEGPLTEAGIIRSKAA